MPSGSPPGLRQSRGMHPMSEYACRRNLPSDPDQGRHVALARDLGFGRIGRIATLTEPCGTGAGDDRGFRGILGLASWRETRTGTRAPPAHAGTRLAPTSARDAVLRLRLGPADRCLRTCGMARPETEAKTKLAQTTIQGELAASSPRGRATGHAATRTARPTRREARRG